MKIKLWTWILLLLLFWIYSSN